MRTHDIACALTAINYSMSTTAPRRMFSGVARAHGFHGGDVARFPLEAMRLNLPAPILLEHDWTAPVGIWHSISIKGGVLFFVGEIANGYLQNAEAAWNAIVRREAECVSIGKGYDEELADAATGLRKRWTIDELSIAEEGLDSGARIGRVWLRHQVIFMDPNRSSDETIWEEPMSAGQERSGTSTRSIIQQSTHGRQLLDDPFANIRDALSRIERIKGTQDYHTRDLEDPRNIAMIDSRPEALLSKDS